MKRYQYTCTLLTDAVITSMAATEGYKESLDYIPGSKFLGIVAGRLYDEAHAEKTLDLFHNGNVKFGDARPFNEDEEYLKVPLSWYYEKGKSLFDEIYLHHDLPKDLPQLKQFRSGYFSPKSKKYISIPQSFSLKSAQDRKNRKSEDGKMFGYFSLKSGSKWTFTIDDITSKYADEIKHILEGRHRIGRSRSAEYGLVEIKFEKEIQPVSSKNLDGELIIYAKSNLAFINEETGNYTSQPTAKQLTGIDAAEVLWDKSQVRTRNYKTWNRKRFNKDSDRIIIEAGSVFVVRLNETISSDFFDNGIGSHKNEGFGEVLTNPDFLNFKNEFKLNKFEIQYQDFFAVNKGDNDDVLLQSLLKIKNQNDIEFQIDQKVNAFVANHKGDFSGISKSQWGTLRNYGKNIQDYDYFKTLIFDKESGFLYKGQSENDWRQNNRRGILEKELEALSQGMRLPFVVKLSNQMAKQKN